MKMEAHLFEVRLLRMNAALRDVGACFLLSLDRRSSQDRMMMR